MSPVVLVRGTLEGTGRESACDVLVWKADSGRRPIFTQFRVIDAPADLPDGRYLLVLEGRVFSTAKENGQWQMQKVETGGNPD